MLCPIVFTLAFVMVSVVWVEFTAPVVPVLPSPVAREMVVGPWTVPSTVVFVLWEKCSFPGTSNKTHIEGSNRWPLGYTRGHLFDFPKKSYLPKRYSCVMSTDLAERLIETVGKLLCCHSKWVEMAIVIFRTCMD